MTAQKPAQAASLRRTAVRVGLVIVYVGLVALTFVSGKGHTILVDNKAAADGSAPAVDGVMVSVDGQEPLEMYAGDRDMAKVKGQSHRVSVEAVAGGKKIERAIRLPMDDDMVLLSVPKLVAGVEPFIERFTPLDAAPPPAGEAVGNVNAFTAPDAAPAVPGDQGPPKPPSL
jgi:hypothetical protein